MAVRMPSLDALRYFEVTARHLSFTAAAEELFISQSAVSQKIRHLEEQLGYPLFQRATRRLIMTKKGTKLLPVVRKALYDIEYEIEMLAEQNESFSLKIHTPPSISSGWLIPRLADFSQKKDDIDIELKVDITAPVFIDEINEVSIAHRKTGSLNQMHELLFKDYIYPVATRELIQKCSLYNVSDLKNAPLLHDTLKGEQLNTNWDDWFTKRKLRNLSTGNSISLTQASMILSAAAEGQGVGLVRHVVAAPLIKAGKLIPLFDDVEEDGGIYIEGSSAAYNMAEVQTFWKWAVKQAKSFNKTYDFKNLEMFRAYEKPETRIKKRL